MTKRERGRRGLAAEAHALMKDREYVREAREVAELMEQLRGPGDDLARGPRAHRHLRF